MLDVVVRMSAWSILGRRLYIVSTRLWMVVDAVTGSERVRGRPRPAKVVRRTVMVCSFLEVASMPACTGTCHGIDSETAMIFVLVVEWRVRASRVGAVGKQWHSVAYMTEAFV